MDTQPSRTTIALAEGAHVGMVGDGARWSIPNAVTDDGLWASSAAEALIAQHAPPAAGESQDLLSWRRDPWSPDFLRGLRSRLVAYTGQQDLSPTAGYSVVFVAPANVDSSALAKNCAIAGLTNVDVVHPLDALLCRWLHDNRKRDYGRPIVAIACGESSVALGAYLITGSERHFQVTAQQHSELAADTQRWSIRLAQYVLDRCTQTGPAPALALLDAAEEFGARLRTCPHHEETPWHGVLSDLMFTPVRFSRVELAEWTEVECVTSSVSTAAASIVQAAGANHGDPLIVIGGAGAAWPFLEDALAPLGSLWRCDAPEQDLAIGAAAWHEFRARFANPLAVEPVQGMSTPPGSGGETLAPPWRRS